MTELLLPVLAGVLIGVSGLRVLDHIVHEKQQDKMNDSLLSQVLKDLDELHSEIEQFGYDVYRREGTLQIRKKRKTTNKK